MSTISQNLQAVSKHILETAQKNNRKDVKLLAVSKTCPPSAVLEAAKAGQLAFGENYEQEAIEKIKALREIAPDMPLEWHFIGPIQSNKTRRIATYFDWVHSVDREKIAKRLSEQRPAFLPPLNICIQVNISDEESKSGLNPQDVLHLAQTISQLPNIKLRGLMAIPKEEKDPLKQREPFFKMKQLFNELQQKGFDIDTLSMGMSADMDAAILEGSTLVRIGTAIFGARK